MKKLLKRYQERLADLSRRNRSIRLAKLAKRRTFDIAALAALDKELPSSVLHAVTQRGRAATLVAVHPRERKGEVIVEDLHLLRRYLDAQRKETGAEEGYLGYPFVQGTFRDGSFFRAPLVLYPVAIETTPQGKSLQLKPQDRKPLLNKTFFLAFNKYNKPSYGVDLKRLDEFEDLGLDALVAWAVQLLTDAGVRVETPRENPTILPIPELAKDAYPSSDPGVVTVLPYAVIGDFSQASSALSADYDALIETERLGPVAERIMGSSKERMPPAPAPLVDPPERGTHVLARPDASQEQVIVAARSGQGIVVHGPPGTGKSEVITNLVADCLARGEKVLVVCEKRAALDVVKNRLGKGGIERYAVLVHDAEADRNAVFARMAANLELFEKQGGVPHAADDARRVDALVERLQDRARAFNTPVHGVPLHALYARSRKDGPRLAVRVHDLAVDEVERLAATVGALQAEGERFDTGALAYRKPFPASFDHTAFLASLKTVVKSLRALDDAYAAVRSEAPSRSVFDLAADYERWRQDRVRGARFVFPSWWTIGRVFEKHADTEGFSARWESFVRASRLVDVDFLRTWFTDGLFTAVSDAMRQGERGSDVLAAVVKSGDALDAVATFDHVKGKLAPYERAVYDACVSARAPDWRFAITNTFYTAWLASAERRVAGMDGQAYETLRRSVADALAARDALTPQLIEERLAARYAELRKDDDGVKLLLHEVQKQRRRPTIRGLNERFIDRGLLELFPSWLCSPETASAIFPLRQGLFDVIVYDEASQLRLERAIPSLVRARRIVVAGDEKQLPPSSFFDSAVEEEEEDETIAEEAQQALEDESLLIRSKYALPGHKLLHHYRSRRAELIGFSNNAFYEGSLAIVPRSEFSSRAAITYTNVHGTWSENRNTKEARHVVRLVKEFLRTAPSKTYGVITFNYKQRELIEDLLDEEAASDALFGKALAAAREKTVGEEDVSLFVKNIENVQGDERDVIIFSIAYARDASGKLRHQFGPLNGVYGGNRLNVAVTRAREAVHVVCSIEPTDLKYSGTFEGPKRLQEYLAYCKRVSEQETETVLDSTMDAFSSAVSEALRKLGHDVVSAGAHGYTIPLAIRHPSKKTYVAGILCENDAYHAVPGAKERDVYKRAILEKNGWTILQVFARDWWNDPEGEARRLDREIKAKL